MLKVNPSIAGLWQQAGVAEAIRSRRKLEGLKEVAI